jgi:hypothetical protein
MRDVAIDKEAFLALWKLDELPACAMEFARQFLIRAGEAVDKLDEVGVLSTRSAFNRAHKDLVAHRSACSNCNEVEKPTQRVM